MSRNCKLAVVTLLFGAYLAIGNFSVLAAEKPGSLNFNLESVANLASLSNLKLGSFLIPASLATSPQSPPVLSLPAGARRYDDAVLKATYVYIPGSYTRPQAYAVAYSLKPGVSYPWVPSSQIEWDRVRPGLGGWPSVRYSHIGIYQLPNGREPRGGWVTVTGEPALLSLFNGSGPDDGCTNGFEFLPTDDGFEIEYGPICKDEDASVTWKDSNGLAEDISVRFKGNVLVEIPWRR